MGNALATDVVGFKEAAGPHEWDTYCTACGAGRPYCMPVTRKEAEDETCLVCGKYLDDEDRPNPARTTQLQRLKALMADGKWRTLANIATVIRSSEAGASARLRDLRKKQHGSHEVEVRRLTGGSQLRYYRVLPHG